ncbi:GNAT family N-acetyltransferase [Frankia sp. AiPs1]|uniref:GNAT family N-acetyltransferase n=1 Tax=Frankia sp. AiPa1 TaxID=573492 RepID=UPI00202B5EF6|nr:sterol carrier protein domain-containing protein [Frankia sp. AiPa1]MCL9758650.1 sterol carrier protein domain-containing protein [Frankia sp. AiPa1]
MPSACLAAGSVAPEERGSRLTVRMLAERIRPLREQGAVLAVVWTTSTGCAHHLGWAAPAQVFSWSVPVDQLRAVFTTGAFEITHGPYQDVATLQHQLAGQWNGPWQRPQWWDGWQQQTHPQLAHYRAHDLDGRTAGFVSLAFDRDQQGERKVVVHDFWASNAASATALLGFLGRFHSRIPTVAFQRTALPPGAELLEQLHRAGSAQARHWHPWMLRILDPAEAVRLRGWPPHLTADLPLTITEGTGRSRAYTLSIDGGKGRLLPNGQHPPGACTMTMRQLTVWYAGGYRTATAATLAGVDGTREAVTALVALTCDREPWLTEYF